MVTSSKQLEIREALLKQGIRHLINQNENLNAILRRLIENIEGQAEKMLAAIFFYDPSTNELSVGAAPNLQPAYQKAVNGFKVGPQQPACGSAVFRQKQVICIDVRTDPLWENLRDVAEGAGFRAVWSHPIFTDVGNVIGTMAFYFPKPMQPDSSNLAVLEIAAGVAAIAMQARPEQVKAVIDARAKSRQSSKRG